MNPVTSDQIKPADKLKLASAPQPDLTLAGIPGGVYDSIQNEYNALNEQVKQGEGQTTNDASDILTLMQDLTGKAQDTATANETAGVNKATEEQNKFGTQLADLNAQATSLNREAQAIPIQVQQDFRNTGATDRGVAPITTGRLRENALRALSIGQQSDIAAAALTGSQIRLQAAKDKAQQMIDIKYKPMEDALAIKKQQYDFNKDILERYDKKRAEALNLTIKKEERDLEEKKVLEKYIADSITTAQAAGAPKETIDAASKAKTTIEAAKILGKYSPETLKYELLKEQIRTEKAQRANYDASAAKTRAETGVLGTTSGKPPTQDQLTTNIYANRVVNSNKILTDLTPDISKLSYAQFKAMEKGGLLNKVLNPKQQKAAQAMRDFINATLRRESGASISDTEFASARQQYFPQYGDTAEVLAQKKQNRIITQDGLIQASGSAYQNLIPNQPVTPQQPNKFQQASGSIVAPFQGTNSIEGINKDGTLNIKLH